MKKLFLFTIAFACYVNVWAQVTDSVVQKVGSSLNINFGMNGDGYYRYDRNEAPTITSQVLEHDAFSLGWLNPFIDGNLNNFSFHFEYVYGPRALEWFGGRKGIGKGIEEAYLGYEWKDKWKLKVGSFNYLFNYEWNEPGDNPNYSVTYMNSVIAAGHSGIRLEYSPNENWTYIVGLFDDWNYLTPFRATGPDLSPAFDATFKNDKFLVVSHALYANTETNKQFFSIENYGDWKVSKHFKLSWDTQFSSYDLINEAEVTPHKDFAAAVYVQPLINEKAKFCWRSEIYAYNGLNANANDAFTILGNTLTFKYTLWKNFEVMPEIRYDWSKSNPFEDFRQPINSNMRFSPNQLWGGLGFCFHIGEHNG